MYNRNDIENFLNSDPIAIAGVSSNPKKFGQIVFNTLKNKGLNVVPINPKQGEIQGQKFINRISDLDGSVKKLLIVTHKKDTLKVAEEAVARGFNYIWIQNNCETEEAIKLISSSQIKVISKACILMYANPKGFHKFHQTISRIFGNYIS